MRDLRIGVLEIFAEAASLAASPLRYALGDANGPSAVLRQVLASIRRGYRTRQDAGGLCRSCPREATAGRFYCPTHAERNAARARASYRVRKERVLMMTMVRIGLAVLVLASLAGCGPFLSVDASADADGGGVAELEGHPLTSSPADGGESDADASSDAGARAEAAAPFAYVPSTAASTFVDLFSRPDGGAVGNGWVEKTPGTFLIEGGEAAQANGIGIVNGRVLRPLAEAALDSEVSARFTVGDPAGRAVLLARVRPESDEPGRLVAYGLEVMGVSASLTTYTSPNPSQQGFGAVWGAESVRPLVRSLALGRSYKLYLRVRGTDPVVLEGGVWDLETNALAASVRGTDAGPYRIVGAGRAGFVSDAQGRWDDFTTRTP